jgi:hypothetical protein
VRPGALLGESTRGVNCTWTRRVPMQTSPAAARGRLLVQREAATKRTSGGPMGMRPLSATSGYPLAISVRGSGCPPRVVSRAAFVANGKSRWRGLRRSSVCSEAPQTGVCFCHAIGVRHPANARATTTSCADARHRPRTRPFLRLNQPAVLPDAQAALMPPADCALESRQRRATMLA